MGIYLNRGNRMFLQARRSPIYVDKSGILSFLNSVIGTEQKYVCVSRPRRFGKSMTLNMIAAFYDRSCYAEKDFQNLSILTDAHWREYANQYNVVTVNMQDFLSESASVEDLLENLQTDLMDELRYVYGEIYVPGKVSLTKLMTAISDSLGIPFVIMIDEWDCLFREYKADEDAQRKYLDFLRAWLKDKPYVGLCYMTGILPIKKYGTHSALNMFTEFSMETPGKLAKFTGFTEEETHELCDRYHMDFSECRLWYDGYSFMNCAHVYNPKSVVDAMLSGIFDDYWIKTETYESLRAYISMNYDGLRDAVISMMAGGRMSIDTGSFQNDMTSLVRADDVMTLLIHLGYLGYDFETKEVFIPNQEILAEFVTATTVNGWDEIIRAINTSEKLLQDTWNGRAEEVAAEIENAHLETSHLQYNDENALSYTISLAYYAAREYYTVVRELPSGKGFADLAFVPRRKYADKPAMLVELKWDKSAHAAIDQIKEKGYVKALPEYHGSLLLVGISYDKSTRKHECIIENYSEDQKQVGK